MPTGRRGAIKCRGRGRGRRGFEPELLFALARQGGTLKAECGEVWKDAQEGFGRREAHQHAWPRSLRSVQHERADALPVRFEESGDERQGRQQVAVGCDHKCTQLRERDSQEPAEEVARGRGEEREGVQTR